MQDTHAHTIPYMNSKKHKKTAARSKREEAQARKVVVGIIIAIVVFAVVMIGFLSMAGL